MMSAIGTWSSFSSLAARLNVSHCFGSIAIRYLVLLPNNIFMVQQCTATSRERRRVLCRSGQIDSKSASLAHGFAGTYNGDRDSGGASAMSNAISRREILASLG